MLLHPWDTFARHSRDSLAEVEDCILIIHLKKVFVKLKLKKDAYFFGKRLFFTRF